MNKTNKTAIVAALLTLSSTAALAQEAVINPNWYVQPSLSIMDQDSDFGVDKQGHGAGLKFGKALNEQWDLQTGYTYARSRGNGERYQQETLGVDALYMFSRKTVRPFFLAGVGAERSRANLRNTAQTEKSSPFLSAGLGFQSDLTERLAMQADLRVVHGFVRHSPFLATGASSNNAYLNFALNYALGPKPQPAPPPAPYVAPAPAPEPAPVAPAPAPAPAPRFEKVTMSATELFAFDSAKLNPNQPKLDELATLLNNNPSVGNVTITGHTDRLGSDKYNQKLSEQRAESVKAYLTGKGVAATRLNAVGKGESQPVVQCDNKKRADLIKCLEPNRRVEVDQVTIERRVN
ncbi:OmpA family protein [Pseudoduganella sp. LjRoot289]|uniref:OmpA family protein n=1 Tax=Pseudoduganella sp. LjRoot289 TaxID=3342314 RepID=UPI003ECE4341